MWLNSKTDNGIKMESMERTPKKTDKLEEVDVKYLFKCLKLAATSGKQNC